MPNVKDNIILEGARIIWRNLAGRAEKFNNEGNRNFAVVIEDLELAERLRMDGWNIKFFPPNEDQPEDQPNAYLKVSVKYDGPQPPMIYIVSGRNRKTLLDEASVEMLDWVDIASSDIVIRPYNWEVNGKEGVSAYVKTMYVNVIEDAFAAKYADDE
jgi:hypothetical protein